MLHKRILLLFLLCSFLSVYAQNTDTTERNYWFHSLTTDNGLSNSNISCLLEDSNGCIWIGTESGANIYDGYTVRMLNLNKDLGISESDNVQTIQEDYLGHIWVNYNGGYVVSVDIHSCISASEYLNSLGIPMTKEANVHIDENGGIWCLDSDNLFYVNLKNNRKYQFASEIKYTFHNDLNVTAAEDQLYVAHENELKRFDLKARTWETLSLPEELSQSNERIKLYIDSEKRKWVFSLQSELLFCQNPDTSDWQKVEFSAKSKDDYSRNQIRDICISQSGFIWIATDHQGIYILNEDLSLRKNVRSGAFKNETLMSDNVACMMRDKRGAIWIGHYKRGISITHPSFGLFDNHEGDYKDVSAILSASDGTMWIGSDGYGLYTEKDKTIEKIALPNIIVSSLCEDKADGSIWVGTFGEGIYNINGKAIKRYSAEGGNLLHNNAWHIAQDKHGMLWYLSGWNTLASFNPKTGESQEYHTSKDETVTGDFLYYDEVSQSVFVGTYWGLCEIDPYGQEHFYYGSENGNQQFLSMQITSLAIDNENSIWWIGHHIGITVWDRKNDHMYFLNKELGLCDNKIMYIVKAPEKDVVWASTTNGLMTIKAERVSGSTLSFSIDSYSTTDGLSDNYFNAAATIDKDNHVYFGNASGYVNINPSQSVSDLGEVLSPKVVFCKVNGEQVPIGELKNLKYSDHDIEINFFTKEILDAPSVKYTYKVEGMNDSWIYTKTPQLYFISLQPGDYKLHVRACGQDGVWGAATVVPITVSAPLSQQLWVKILINAGAILLLAIFVAIFIWRYRKRLHDMHEELEAESTERVVDMKLQFFGHLNSDLRKPVKKILTKVDRILKGEYEQEAIPEVLADVKAEGKILDKNLSSLLDFHRLESGGEYLILSDCDFVAVAKDECSLFDEAIAEKKIRYTFTSDAESIMMHCDEKKLRRVLSHVLSNAFKNSLVKGKVDLSITHDAKNIQIEIADTGLGISEEEHPHVFKRFFQSEENTLHTGSGVGLSVVWKYVTMHNGKVSFKDNEPCGVVFKIELPLITEAKKEYQAPEEEA
ncbi:MAG: hypothetical protein HUJ97_03265 [Bacteroidales bacterium]|nr:hypothetical protein [Bacteroidales bacterium]